MSHDTSSMGIFESPAVLAKDLGGSVVFGAHTT